MKRAYVTNNLTQHNRAKNLLSREASASGFFDRLTAKSPRADAARLTRSRRRRGFTLIELMVVIAIVTVILSLVGAVFQRLFLSEQTAMRAALIERTVSRLADQFRRDIHAATGASIDTNREGATGALELFEANRDQPAVVYVARTDEVIREQHAADASVTHREVFRLPDCRVSFFDQAEQPDVPFVSLAIERQHSTITPQPQAARPYRTLVVEAALGRDNRLTTKLKLKSPAATQEESK